MPRETSAVRGEEGPTLGTILRLVGVRGVQPLVRAAVSIAVFAVVSIVTLVAAVISAAV